MTVKLV